MKGLDNIKTELSTRVSYVSKFDFETFEINKEDADYVTEREKSLVESGEKYNESLFEICKALSEVAEKLKDHKQGTFMAWYCNIGLNKDKVSELLKRWSLYEERPDLIPYISGLSGLAVRIITGKSVTQQMRNLVFEGKFTSSEDIRQLIMIEDKREDKVQEKKTIPFYKNVFDYEKKIEKMKPSEAHTALSELREIKREVSKLEKLLKAKEEAAALENNLKLPE